MYAFLSFEKKCLFPGNRNLSSYMKYFEDAVKDVVMKVEGKNHHPIIFGKLPIDYVNTTFPSPFS